MGFEEFRPLISGRQWAQLLTHFRPFLHPFLPTIADTTEIPSAEAIRQVPLNGVNCLLSFCDSTFTAVARVRYHLNIFERARDLHMQLGRYFRARSELAQHPMLVKGIREYAYHMTKARMWSTLMQCAFTIHHISKCYHHHVGYVLYRDYLHALNQMHEYCETKKQEDSSFAQSQAAQFESWLNRIKEYTDFVYRDNVALSHYPSLTYQQALNAVNSSPVVYEEACEYYSSNPSRTHFVWMNKQKSKIHNHAVSTAMFSPNSIRLLTASLDKTIKYCTLSGDVSVTLQGITEGILFAVYSRTSKYVVAVCKDRCAYVYDAATGTHLCKLSGHFGHIKACDLSCRGRYIGTGSEDRTLRIWESETGRELTSISHNTYCSSTSPFSAVACVQAHPNDEDVWLSACDRTVLVWSVGVDYAAQCLMSVVAHTVHPVFQCVWGHNASCILTCTRLATDDDKSLQPSATPSEDTLVKIWSVRTGRVVSRLVGASQLAQIKDFSVSACGSMACVVSSDHTAIVWKLDWQSEVYNSVPHPDTDKEVSRVLQPLCVLKGSGPLTLCTFSHCSQFVTTVSANLAQVWSITDTRNIRVIMEFLTDKPVTCLNWCGTPTADTGHLLLGDQIGKVYLLKCVNLPSDAPSTASKDLKV
eukprot:NODE_214_length_2289_cov_64.900555_g208_i0.p1 GENE.NODE_214_length_2289_cov_64.900555_g208_i0~~NODE_214_length_2289_cov_64.900555_g208_i0.p1  ORF type:complete len:747 (+),score=177.77 NODE_214_length_2289_cov_64.900555_g208_i0:310-2241(+)